MSADKNTATSFTFSNREMPIRMGRYHLISRLNQDPIGEEFLAGWGVEEGVEQLRVIRCIYPRVAREAEFIALFSEEARALSRMGSENIARIMEVNIDGEIPFVAREYVEGLTLARMVEIAQARTQLWPWDVAVHLVGEVLRGLDYIHRREDLHGKPMGMRHGDVRPDNTLISFGGVVKLTNFGSMLRFIVDEATHARLSQVRWRFVPPEGEEEYEPTVDGDLWAAAMMLLLLLGGEVPKTVKPGWTPPALRDRVSGLPEMVDSFIARALNPQKDFRYKTAAAMRSGLVEILAEYAPGQKQDDLAAFVRALGNEDKREEERLISEMMGRPANMNLGSTAGSASVLGPGYVLDDRYHLLRELGEGGMGTVFEAEHVGLDRKVAIKVLHERVMSDTNTVERFKREARIIGKLGHPNIVGALDFGMSEQGHYFLVMDMLDGKSLATRIWEGNLSCQELCEIMAGVCDGLHAAHEAGVIHRDLKPDNILITDKGPRILDFGIAKKVGLEESNEALTRTGHICGTVDYIAPEQIRGGTNDPRSDVYGVGVIIYEALTGEPPFHGRTVGEALHKAINDKLVPPGKRSGRKDIPAQLEAICLKALSRDVEKRFRSAKEMGDALRKVADKLRGNNSVTRSSLERLTLETRDDISILGGRSLVPVMLVVLVLAGGIGGYLFWSGGGPDVPHGEVRARETIDEKPFAEKKPSTKTESGDVASTVVDSGQVEQKEGHPSEDVIEQTGLVKVSSLSTSISQNVSEAKQDKYEQQRDESLAKARERTKEGFALLKVRNYKGAVAKFKEAVHHNHRESAAWYGMGKAAFGNGSYGDAISYVVRSINYASAARAVERRVFLGVVYQAAGRKAEAVAEWQKVLRGHPDNQAARRYLERAGVAVPKGDK